MPVALHGWVENEFGLERGMRCCGAREGEDACKAADSENRGPNKCEGVHLIVNPAQSRDPIKSPVITDQGLTIVARKPGNPGVILAQPLSSSD